MWKCHLSPGFCCKCTFLCSVYAKWAMIKWGLGKVCIHRLHKRSVVGEATKVCERGKCAIAAWYWLLALLWQSSHLTGPKLVIEAETKTYWADREREFFQSDTGNKNADCYFAEISSRRQYWDIRDRELMSHSGVRTAFDITLAHGWYERETENRRERDDREVRGG